MSLAGLGAVAIWHDLLPEARDAFYEWHNREHMPERCGIPGFRRGRRYIAFDGAPEYFNLYEADSPEVLGGVDYLTRLNHPTPWTRAVVPSFRNVTRGICRVLYSAGVGQGGLIATLRFALPEAVAGAAVQALRQRVLPPLVDAPGVVGVHLLRADDAISRIETSEKQARGDATAIPACALLVEASDERALRAPLAALDAELAALGAVGREVACYRVQYQRCKLPGGDR
jgi:hypothetical protein